MASVRRRGLYAYILYTVWIDSGTDMFSCTFHNSRSDRSCIRISICRSTTFGDRRTRNLDNINDRYNTTRLIHNTYNWKLYSHVSGNCHVVGLENRKSS